jgi:hypothetical protein
MLRTHLMAAYRQTGIMPDQLRDAPELPELGAHVWKWYCELDQCRKSGEPITNRDILDWQQLYGQKLEPWELRAIKTIDRVYLGIKNE